jgi:Secretion system C-terminal sorting domain
MKRLVLFIIGVFVCILLQAQNVIPSSGGDAAGSGGSASYTVGQIVYTTNTDVTSGSVSQGVQQPYEISVITSLEEAKDISLEIVVYPNPATDFIRLKIENYEAEDLSYQLYNSNGTPVKNDIIQGRETTISMQNLLPATYFLKIIDDKIIVKTFKLIKN